MFTDADIQQELQQFSNNLTRTRMAMCHTEVSAGKGRKITRMIMKHRASAVIAALQPNTVMRDALIGIQK